ncbi:hypothetical protein GJ744_000346 [Endocarpon pusillum]|uniref:Uncharacterized protein n=1 Tax=Endocarpon pusillum TaxID=364733 RepID=A0A8H7ASL2_9EURO|nr:hypothetical protein GJ744_000346 [Endocarpon pusillum]
MSSDKTQTVNSLEDWRDSVKEGVQVHDVGHMAARQMVHVTTARSHQAYLMPKYLAPPTTLQSMGYTVYHYFSFRGKKDSSSVQLHHL